MAVVYKHLSLDRTASTTQVDTGVGRLEAVIITGAVSKTSPAFYLRDGTSVSDPIILQFPETISTDLPRHITVGAQYSTGLFVEWPGGTSGQSGILTLLYDGDLTGKFATSVNTTTVGNVGGGEDDLMSYSIPANFFHLNNKAIRVLGFGAFAANANTKTLRAKFGATSITCNATTTAPNGLVWRVVFDVIRTGSNTQVLNLACNAGAVWQASSEATPTETDSGAIIVKFTGESGSSATNDIVQRAMIVEAIA